MSERKFKPVAWFQDNETKVPTTVAVTEIQGRDDKVTRVYGTAGKNGLIANLEKPHLVVRERADGIHEVSSYRLPSDQAVLAMLANTAFGNQEAVVALLDNTGDIEKVSREHKLLEQLGMTCLELTRKGESIMYARGRTVANYGAEVLYDANINRAQFGVDDTDWRASSE